VCVGVKVSACTTVLFAGFAGKGRGKGLGIFYFLHAAACATSRGSLIVCNVCTKREFKNEINRGRRLSGLLVGVCAYRGRGTGFEGESTPFLPVQLPTAPFPFQFPAAQERWPVGALGCCCT